MKKQILSVLFLCITIVAFGQKTSIKKTTTKKTTKTTKIAPSTSKPIIKPTTKKMDTTTYVLFTTNFGDIEVKLFNATPLHKANFIKIVQDGVIDSTLFHRIIPGFMIQGGDPNSKNAAPGERLGMGGLPYKVPAELFPTIIHQKGALAAARDNNPEKASSSTQFYICQGKTYTDAELNMFEQRNGFKYTEEQKTIYKTIGGTPMLDMNYTVFGEVVAGLEVVDKIIAQPRDKFDRPTTDIRMKVKIVEK